MPGDDPFSGTVIVFRSRRADRIKILVWDASGHVLVWKQLGGNVFRWPPIVDGVMRLSFVEFAALFDGFDWSCMGMGLLHQASWGRSGAVCWVT